MSSYLASTFDQKMERQKAKHQNEDGHNTERRKVLRRNQF